MLSVMEDNRRSLTMPHSVEGDIILGQLLEHCKLIHWLGWAGGLVGWPGLGWAGVLVFVLTLQISDLSQHVGLPGAGAVIAWIRHQ